MERKEAIKTIKEAESCFCKHGAYKDCHSKCKFKDALEMAIASLETDEAYQLEYERPGECKAEDITEEQVVTYLHYHGMMAVSKELWHAMYDEMIKNGVTVEEQQGENT